MIILPYCQCQPDAPQVITEVHENIVPDSSFWVSAYHQSSPSVHGKVRASKENSQITLTGEDGISLASHSSQHLEITCPDLNLQTRFALPRYISPQILPKIECFDIAADRYVAGGTDGSLTTGHWRNSTSAPLQLKGHVGDIRSAKFFPSGEVILSVSIDMSLRIFSAIDGSNPRILKGHKGTVTTTAFVDRGATLYSGSMDSTVKLWEVASSEIKQSWKFAGAKGVRNMVLQDQTLVVGLGNGDTVLLDTRSGDRATFSGTTKDSIDAVDYSADADIIATGNSAGVVTIFDSRMTERTPLKQYQRTTGAYISDLKLLPSSKILVSSSDGMPYILNHETDKVEQEFAGFDNDPICGSVVTPDGDIWLSGADGKLRRY